MAGYADVYVLASARDAELLARFLDRFALSREESAVDYHVPQYSDTPALVYQRAADLVSYLVAHPDELHAVYWRNIGDGPAHAMAFFTGDGGLVLGLSCRPREADQWYAELTKFAGTGVGYMTHECHPAYDTVADFRAVATAWANSSS